MSHPIQPADIQSHVLRNDVAEIHLLSVGCAVQSWTVAGTNVVLGYSDPADYLSNPPYLGVVVGRVANRVGNAEFTLDGERFTLPANNGPHCLHGGEPGFGHRNWTLTPVSETEALFTLESPDGEQGFPGNLRTEVRLTLDGHSLTYDMRATPDRVTPINLAQHIYFNLMGTGGIMEHTLHTAASHYLPADDTLAPVGDVAPVAGTMFDFTTARTLAEADPDRIGSDICLVLDDSDEPAATLSAPNGMRLRLWTNRPALQLYTTPWLTPQGKPMPGQTHEPLTAICLEAQDYVDAMRHGFPSILHGPDTPYHQRTTIEIAPAG